MDFTDLRTALRMREVFTRIAEDTVERMRPEEKIGKVYSFNRSTQTAQILFAGETVNNLVTVGFALDKIPSTQMATSYDELGDDAPADIVRIAGRPGKYYILDYVSGAPNNTQVPTGVIWEWPTATAPPGFLLLSQVTFSSEDYPALASLLGDTWGTHSGTTYYLPDHRGRVALGVGTASPAVPGGTAHTLGQKGGEEKHTLTVGELAAHNHLLPYHIDGWHAWTLTGAGGAGYWVNQNTTHTTQNAGSDTPHNVLNPYIGMNFIIKT